MEVHLVMDIHFCLCHLIVAVCVCVCMCACVYVCMHVLVRSSFFRAVQTKVQRAREEAA